MYRLMRNNYNRIHDALKSNNLTYGLTSSIAGNSGDLLACRRQLFYQWILFQILYPKNN